MGNANSVKEEVASVVRLLLVGRNVVPAQKLLSLVVAHMGLAFESVEND